MRSSRPGWPSRAACSGAKRAWTASRIFAFSLLRAIHDRSAPVAPGCAAVVVRYAAASGVGCEWLQAASARRAAAHRAGFRRIVRSSSGRSGPRKDRGSTLNRPPDQGARYAPYPRSAAWWVTRVVDAASALAYFSWSDSAEAAMANAPAAVVFDIFGTLFSLEPVGERLERAGLPRSSLDLLFARTLRDAFALEVARD